MKRWSEIRNIKNKFFDTERTRQINEDRGIKKRKRRKGKCNKSKESKIDSRAEIHQYQFSQFLLLTASPNTQLKTTIANF